MEVFTVSGNDADENELGEHGESGHCLSRYAAKLELDGHRTVVNDNEAVVSVRLVVEGWLGDDVGVDF